MKNGSVDITCRSRLTVLELYEKLRDVDGIYYVRLVESNHINVLLGWVPIPLSNDRIKVCIEEVFGKVIKIVDKKHKDGLQSGMRIISMNKDELEANPIPSYICIDGFELYVPYTGHESTCKYCGEPSHLQ